MLLAPGDAVEVIEDLNPGYRIKLSSPWHGAIFTCADADLYQFELPGFDALDGTTISSYDTLSSKTKDERRAGGQCEQCGRKLEMSVFGLLPCPRCKPEPQAKW